MKQSFLISLFLGLFFAPFLRGEEILVDGSRPAQVIRGFGACSAWVGGKITDDLAQMFFDPKDGIGLSILRTRIPPDGNWNPEVSPMKQAQAWGVTQFWSAEWTPPPALKSNHDINNGGSLMPEHYQDYADYLVRYAKDLKSTYQIDLYALSPQNEPDFKATYESCLWTGEQFRTFVRDDLGPAFKANGLTTRIMISESNQNDLTESDPALSDPAAAVFVGIVGEHIYGGGPLSYPLAREEGKDYWETEISDFKNLDPGMNSGIKYALQIYRCLAVAGMNAYHYWWLVPGGKSNNNEALTDAVGRPTKRMYCLGNYSKFIRPGFVRVEVTAPPGKDPWVSGYVDRPSGRFVVVAVNSLEEPVTQAFRLAGMNPGTVTPWLTDDDHDLEKQTGLRPLGGKFTYAIPALSVVSFVGQASAFAPTATPTPQGMGPSAASQASCLVDDFEKGGKVNRRGGTWGTYVGPQSHLEFTVVAGGCPASPAYCAYLKGEAPDWGGMTCPLSQNDSAVDLSNYRGICFYALGNGETYWFQAAIPSITDGDHYGRSFAAPATWTPVTIFFDEMAQRNFGAYKPFTPEKVKWLQWANQKPGPVDLKVDDVRLLGADCP